jgi:hypothetical protein
MHICMGAGAYVARIGGLAVALGIGAAVLVGQGVASADTRTIPTFVSNCGHLVDI